jgi:hypothetical protein
MSFYTIIPGPTSSGGSDFPLASDVNQFAKAFSGVEDVGTLTLASPTPDPTTAPTCAASAGSSLGVGTYVYAFTRVVGHVRDSAAMVVTGETLPSPTTSVTTTSGNQSVQLTLPTSPGAPVIGRRVYRTTVGGSQLKERFGLTHTADGLFPVEIRPVPRDPKKKSPRAYQRIRHLHTSILPQPVAGPHLLLVSSRESRSAPSAQ